MAKVCSNHLTRLSILMHAFNMHTKTFRPLAVTLLFFSLATVSLVRSQQPATPAPAAGYRLILRSSSEPYQVSTPDEPRRKNWFVITDKNDSASTFGDTRTFRAVKFEKKTTQDPSAGKLDASELTVMDLKTSKTYTLVLKKEQVVKD
jgi:hypothetical protein